MFNKHCLYAPPVGQHYGSASVGPEYYYLLLFYGQKIGILVILYSRLFLAYSPPVLKKFKKFNKKIY